MGAPGRKVVAAADTPESLLQAAVRRRALIAHVRIDLSVMLSGWIQELDVEHFLRYLSPRGAVDRLLRFYVCMWADDLSRSDRHFVPDSLSVPVAASLRRCLALRGEMYQTSWAVEDDRTPQLVLWDGFALAQMPPSLREVYRRPMTEVVFAAETMLVSLEAASTAPRPEPPAS